MMVIYGLMAIAVVYGVIMLLRRKKTNSAEEQGSLSKNIPNRANSNEGGNSQRAENTNDAGSAGAPDGGINSMGADNDDDKLNAAKTAPNLKKDFENYQNDSR